VSQQAAAWAAPVLTQRQRVTVARTSGGQRGGALGRVALLLERAEERLLRAEDLRNKGTNERTKQNAYRVGGYDTHVMSLSRVAILFRVTHALSRTVLTRHKSGVLARGGAPRRRHRRDTSQSSIRVDPIRVDSSIDRSIRPIDQSLAHNTPGRSTPGT